jgi:type III pantothenate kinase
VRRIIISTVVPRALHNLQVLADKYFGLEAMVAGQGDAAWGFLADVDEPRSLGADRALNVIAGHAGLPGEHLIIIDFGTATTFDWVDPQGTYKGGIIAPGINLSLDALVNAAAKLPRIAISVPRVGESVIGRNTEDQMHIGVFWGYVAMMEGLIARMRAEIGEPAKVIATGARCPVRSAHTDF